MTARNAWLNRERLAFLAAAAALAAAGLWAVRSRPEFPDPGQHRVTRSAPGKLHVSLDEPEPLAAFMAGDRDPFSHPVAAEQRKIAEADGSKQKVSVHGDIYPFPVVGGGRNTHTTDVVRPYQVPVNFVGVTHLPGTGDIYVTLKTKQGGENRNLREGDLWPETGLRIVRITENSVDLRNERGELFRMLDLYGRRAGAGAQGARLAGT